MKNKATLVFSLLLVAMLSLFFSITIYMEKQLYSWMEQRFSAELLESANFIDGVLLTLNLEMTVNQLDPFIDSISQKSIERITIIDSMGKVIADSDLNVSQILTVENHKSRPEIISATNIEPGTAIRFSETLKESLMYLAIPYQVDENKGFIRVAISLAEITHYMNDLRKLLNTVALICFLILGLLTFFAFKFIERIKKK